MVLRLSDTIKQSVGTCSDLGGSVQNLSEVLEAAQRFDLASDVVAACFSVARSRPTTVAKALPLCRLPFPSTWVEWRPDPDFADEAGPHETPNKMGVLLEELAGGRIRATWAWSHDGDRAGVTICGFGAIFDWSGAGIDPESVDPAVPFPPLRGYLAALNSRDRDPANLANAVQNWSRKAPFFNCPREEAAAAVLVRTAIIAITKHSLPAVNALASGVPLPVQLKLAEAWRGDLAGEALFIQAVIAMFNSRNAIEVEEADLDRLNKSRARRHRPELLPYYVTRLKIAKTQFRYIGGIVGARDLQRHAVRGHFKVRGGKIFWWSSHQRGDQVGPTRGAYVVS